jgi:hypothetical protein
LFDNIVSEKCQKDLEKVRYPAELALFPPDYFAFFPLISQTVTQPYFVAMGKISHERKGKARAASWSYCLLSWRLPKAPKVSWGCLKKQTQAHRSW